MSNLSKRYLSVFSHPVFCRDLWSVTETSWKDDVATVLLASLACNDLYQPDLIYIAAMWLDKITYRVYIYDCTKFQ